MPAEPQIQRLSYTRRRRFFWTLLLTFFCVLPIIILYTTGYRYDFTLDEPALVPTGGIYITVDDRDALVYLNEAVVTDRRLFQNAVYIQNVPAGMHRLVVQREGLETWVKDIHVSPYLVTEVAAFNTPLVPRVRYVTPVVTTDGVPVMTGTSSVFAYATSVTPIVVATSTATVESAYIDNLEFQYVQSLFRASSTPRQSLLSRVEAELETFTFRSLIATSTGPPATTTATTTVTRGDLALYERQGELYAGWRNGSITQIPFYFCLDHQSASSTREWYGDHVLASLQETFTPSELAVPGRLCRTEIRLDRKGQDVYFFDFVPDRTDLVLIQLSDGLYVSEIDDRSWQNVQSLFESSDLAVVVENGRIFAREGDVYFELLVTVDDPS